MSTFGILLQLRMMEVVVTTRAISHAKLQSNRHQQSNTQLSTCQMPFQSPNQQRHSTKGAAPDTFTVYHWLAGAMVLSWQIICLPNYYSLTDPQGWKAQLTSVQSAFSRDSNSQSQQSTTQRNCLLIFFSIYKEKLAVV